MKFEPEKIGLPILNMFRPLFEKGPLKPFKVVFETVEYAIFYPKDRTEGAPHVRDPLDLKRYMGVVLAAMMPCILASIFFFGPRVIAMIIVSYAVGGLTEVFYAMARKGEVHEGFFVTGMIFPMILPPSTPLWMVGVGVFFGVFFGKEIFGGTGRNIFNPALVGRLFLTISFPATMTSGWDAPFAWLRWFGVESFGPFDFVMRFFGWVVPAVDAVTGATPMGIYKTTQVAVSNWHLLWGATGGSIGETFHLGIIFGGIFLMFTKVADWRIPVFYIGSAVFLSAIGHSELPGTIAPLDFQLLGGGMLFGAMYMATDPVTSPFTRGGKIIFGCGCGLLTVLIRAFSGYVEGVMFSIVIMNAFAPLIDHMVLQFKFREAKA